ncbi:MAG: hypothetical protein IH988_05470 [Planctomycetes bacterium]|nr:hypothetical protein [Planctomycetota bacterium]
MVNGTIWGRREADERQFQEEHQMDGGMRIVYDVPPLFDEISARFELPPKGVIFAWGDIIYNPTRVDIPHQLIAHEAVHGRRQAGDPEGWWRRYLVDNVFRLEEEIHAHIAEYLALMGPTSGRQQRRSALKLTARRLAAPLYGYGPLVTRKTAIGLLRAAL